jgi:hypothetical protein
MVYCSTASTGASDCRFNCHSNLQFEYPLVERVCFLGSIVHLPHHCWHPFEQTDCKLKISRPFRCAFKTQTHKVVGWACQKRLFPFRLAFDLSLIWMPSKRTVRDSLLCMSCEMNLFFPFPLLTKTISRCLWSTVIGQKEACELKSQSRRMYWSCEICFGGLHFCLE